MAVARKIHEDQDGNVLKVHEITTLGIVYQGLETKPDDSLSGR
ncbi:unnamed protein product, partial [marine sediment metagenome]